MHRTEHSIKRLDPGIGAAVIAAVLFGASTPLAKLLTGQIHPVTLAALLYLGAGAGLLAWSILRRAAVIPTRVAEAAMGSGDLPWLAGSIVFGGVLAPVLLMWGLTVTPAASASLLLNLEAVFTVLLAWLAFREHFDWRIALGMVLIVLGGVTLSWDGSPSWRLPIGALAIASACLCWAIDNNLTRRISDKDPLQVAGLKCLVSGLVNLLVAIAIGAHWPRPWPAFGAGAVGLLGYGVSLALFVFALRRLGTSRTSAYFSSAPFVGASIAVIFLHETPGAGFWLAAALMGVGLWLHLSERHGHLHLHEVLVHEHGHVHDAHHQHDHDFQWEGTQPHAHFHVHGPLSHSHRHYPDIHHRHDHG